MRTQTMGETDTLLSVPPFPACFDSVKAVEQFLPWAVRESARALNQIAIHSAGRFPVELI